MACRDLAQSVRGLAQRGGISSDWSGAWPNGGPLRGLGSRSCTRVKEPCRVRGLVSTASAVGPISTGEEDLSRMSPRSEPKASPSAITSHGYTGYEASFGSLGFAVFTNAPGSPRSDGSIWYYGNHPHPANSALGPFCDLQGSHHHDYVPYQNHRYVFNDGHYFWVGDAKPYAPREHSYAYQGHHPHPHYFGGYCRIRGLHQHAYAPRSADYYRLKNGAYFFTGVYDPDYYAERNRYDTIGWKLDHRASGYREHERAGQGGWVAERMDVQRVTPQELVERMRERTRDASGSALANAADDGVRE
jgi:hypothetical protein